MFLYNKGIQNKGLVVNTEGKSYYDDLLQSRTKLMNKTAEVMTEYFQVIGKADGNKKILKEAADDSNVQLQSLYTKFAIDVTNTLDRWIGQIKNDAKKVLDTSAIKSFQDMQKDDIVNYADVSFKVEGDISCYTYDPAYKYLSGTNPFYNLTSPEIAKVLGYLAPESEATGTFEVLFGMDKESFTNYLKGDKISSSFPVNTMNTFVGRLEAMPVMLDTVKSSIASSLKEIAVDLGADPYISKEDHAVMSTADRFIILADTYVSGLSIFLETLDTSTSDYELVVSEVAKIIAIDRIKNS